MIDRDSVCVYVCVCVCVCVQWLLLCFFNVRLQLSTGATFWVECSVCYCWLYMWGKAAQVPTSAYLAFKLAWRPTLFAGRDVC
jgi:hypothetical protein